MKIPKQLEALVHEGMIDGVVRQLMSGKEASVYIVRCGEAVRCAKVYKEANKRGFRQAALYQEGRKTKNSREARAMAKGSRFGREKREEAWQSVEVDTLYLLAGAGVRVPKPHGFLQGVVLMELVTDDQGHVAPRLNDIELPEGVAMEYHAFMMRQIVLMLCAGIIHGDLSEYNVLVGRDGPVIIDLPQAVNAAGNNNAAAMLKRDADNITAYFSRFAPALAASQYGKEIWSLYERGALQVDSQLTGRIVADTRPVDLRGVMREIDDVRKEHEAREIYKAALQEP
ncbi:MAG TPA: PA4780 family RIO1-like protein kinase [Casimicrobiaceae bacterium]|nr:PA4780 family RIO1-like protein kinase [Casimicrobiaceae bacterium]